MIIEGGKQTLESFIQRDLWDEARIFTSSNIWDSGIKSPELKGNLIYSQQIKSDQLEIFKR